MRIAFQADADLSDDIVKGVKRRVPEIDFQNASDAGLEELEDEVVLALAANENRIPANNAVPLCRIYSQTRLSGRYCRLEKSPSLFGDRGVSTDLGSRRLRGVQKQDHLYRLNQCQCSGVIVAVCYTRLALAFFDKVRPLQGRDVICASDRRVKPYAIEWVSFRDQPPHPL